MKTHYKHPRLFTYVNLGEVASEVLLSGEQSHYLGKVLRKSSGDMIRIFNGWDGEFLAEILSLDKKSGTVKLVTKTRDQPTDRPAVHLIFAPIKKKRLDFLIEKAVELGVTDLHPVLTQRTQNPKINEKRLHAQIIEAAEQCERMDIPTLHKSAALSGKLMLWDSATPILACLERQNAAPLHTLKPLLLKDRAFLIGPEGGFDQQEMTFLGQKKYIHPVSLGENILRAETAAIFCLSLR